MRNRIYRHIEGLNVKAIFAEENGIQFRYRLEMTLKDSPQNGLTVCAIMQNPSYAGEKEADKSVQFLENVVFQRKKKFPEFDNARRLIIINQFAQIQTNGFVGNENAIGQRNNSIISESLAESDIILIAWGATNSYEDRKNHIIDLINGVPDKTLFKTRMHPSRGRYDGFIEPYTF